MNWTDCTDDGCLIHLGEKQGSGWYQKFIRRSTKPSVAWDHHWRQEMEANPGEDWAPQQPRRRRARRAHHQQKNILRQICRRCALTQAMSLLRSLHLVRPEFRCNALYLLTRPRVVLTPWLHLNSGSLHFLLMMAPASHCLFRTP